MKKTIITIITAMLTIGAMAQVNAVGIPFGISKTKAVELLRSKYGNYADYAMDRITYVNFRLDGVSYDYAHFFFDDDMKFTKATFHMREHELSKAETTQEDVKHIVEQLNKQPYMVVCLDEFGVGQTYFNGGVGIRTLYRAIPKNAAMVKHSYVINVLAFVDEDGIEIVSMYEPKDL
jgi:hypothetical protein